MGVRSRARPVDYNGSMVTTSLLTSEHYLAMPEEFDQSGNRIKDELLPDFSAPVASFFDLQ